MHESEAIPFDPLNLRGERLLVLAPHPDDEVIGCGGLVALHLRERRRVRVIVATDGAQAGDAAMRESECRAALTSLGDAEVEFLRLPDRDLENAAELQSRLAAILHDYKPDLIAVPSAIEIHPDHLALSRAFCDAVAGDESLFADLAIAQVAFYEVSAPMRPNALVDISEVAEAKYAAIAMHASQLAVRDYVSYARGLNAYRTMSLPGEVKAAEAYYVIKLNELRTLPFSALQSAMSAPRAEVVAEPLPITVVVRTKDRPALLREAIESIRATRYPADIVVVNDGGAAVDVENATVIRHETSLGRSEAANAGVRATKSAFVSFLDDDDLLYPEHFATLAKAASGSGAPAWYSDAVSAFVKSGETTSRMRLFGGEFDRELLLVDNYIPLPTALFRRSDFLDLGGFDPAFDLFEDWDFLIRLSRRGDFVHVERITCEIRHIEGAGSVTMSSPEGSPRFREAKLQLWRKHAALIDENLFADVFEKQKRRAAAQQNSLVEARGYRGHLEQNVDRVAREKAALQERLNETLMRISHLDGANTEIRGHLERAENDRNELLAKVGELGDARAGFDEAQRTISALWTEVTRLQGLLDTIYASRTWKLHSIVEKMKGRD
jgi:LmbE family N-acetylglucosaminyl deacetylase/glycosyltransferase involved in cell wall biosynthesis